MSMTTEQIIEDITSRDTHKVWSASCEIISLCQDRNRIFPLIEHLPEIKKQTQGLEMGGAFAPNQRFIDFAIRVIEFHRNSPECTCSLYPEHESIDPHREAGKGSIEILGTSYIEERWVDYYSAACKKCGQKFKIIEREYHYTWWGWTKSSE
jgi:hypothetical protein